MEHRFRPIRVQFPFCIRDHEHTSICQGNTLWEVDAIECTGTGLAIQKVFDRRWEDYTLVHIASGTLLLAETVPTLVQAGMWLRKVRALCDWTQPAYQLKIQSDTKQRVYQAWVDTMLEYDVLLRGKKFRISEQEGGIVTPDRVTE